MRAGKRRHIVNVMRPTEALDEYGQSKGVETYWFEVPCTIETIGGSEPEAGSQQQAISTYKIDMYGDPTKPLEASDYLTLGPPRADGTLRKLNIQQIVDEQQNGIKLTLICGERHEPRRST